MIQGTKVNQDRSMIPSSNINNSDIVRAQSIVNPRDTFSNRQLSLLSPNQKNQVQQPQIGDQASSPSGAIVPENLSIKPISREKRV